MKKVLTVLVCALALSGVLFACTGEETADFDVLVIQVEDVTNVDAGTYTAEYTIAALEEYLKAYELDISVSVTSDGQAVSVTDESFTVEIGKVYEVTITVTADGRQSKTAKYMVTAKLQEYDVTLNIRSDDAGAVNGAGSYRAGTEVTVTATTNDGYIFAGWYDILQNLLTEQESYTFTVTENVSLYAYWEEITKFEVTLYSSPNYGVTLTGAGRYAEGTEVTVTATANENYIFIGWLYVTGASASSDASYTFTVTDDITLYAEWEVGPLLPDMFEQNGALLRQLFDDLEGEPVNEYAVYTGHELEAFIADSYFPSTANTVAVLAADLDALAIELDSEQAAADMLEYANLLFAETGVNLYHRIGNIVFYDMLGISEVLTGNAYKAEDGNYYSKDNKKLLYYNGEAETYSIAEGIEEIKPFAFIGNLTLINVELPSTLQIIGNAAFFICSSLETVTVLAAVPPQMGTEVFAFISLKNLTIYVPYGSVEAYRQADGWSYYANIIQAVSAG